MIYFPVSMATSDVKNIATTCLLHVGNHDTNIAGKLV